jgi:DNA (cytosine-5)-methyltransferase 1
MDHTADIYDLSDSEGFLKEIEGKHFDVIVGGPPCQDFSSAGHRKEQDRANLTRSYAEIVSSIKPLYFVMENVSRTRNSMAYQVAREMLVEAGYGLTEMVLDSSYCGVPQIRKRFFCIGTLGENNNFMEEIILESLGKKRMTIRDYFGKKIDVDHYYRHPRNYNRRGVFSIDEPSMTIRGVNRPVPGGYKGHHGDTAPVDEKLRPLTTQERSQIQTFPPNFKWIGSKTDSEQMIGNAVPVNLGKFVADCIVEFEKIRVQQNKVA